MDFSEDVSDDQKVTQYLNNCALAQETPEKISYFFKVQEILLRKTPVLLPKYLQNILNFTTERNADIKKALVGFIEELIKVRGASIPKVMMHLHMLLCDASVVVQKRAIQGAITIYRKTLAWLCKASVTTNEMDEAWKQLSAIKLQIANMIDSDNVGVRSSSIKFLEYVVLLQTYSDEYESRRLNDFSLDNVPFTIKVARRSHLEEEASNFFEVLVKFHGAPYICSSNLLVCIGVLANIAKSRAKFMVKVVNAFESLFTNLPPTLTTSQVSSVRKKLKTELGGLLKHPAAYVYVNRISPILLQLGCSRSEVNRLIPRDEERQKYEKRTLSSESIVQQRVKQASTEHTSFEFDEYGINPLNANKKFILGNLPGKKIEENPSKKRSREAEEGNDDREKSPPKKKFLKLNRTKPDKLAEITKPLERDLKETLMIKYVERLLSSHRSVNKQLHQKWFANLATTFSLEVRDTVLKFLLNDLRSHVEIALAWLFEEYNIMKGFIRVPPIRTETKLDDSYNLLLCRFINVSGTDASILSRLLLEAPCITDDALEEVRAVCRDDTRSGWALGLLRDLTVGKPPKQLVFLNVLLSYTTYECDAVRDSAIKHVLELHKRSDLRLVIEEFARTNLELLKLPKPPGSLCGINQGRLKTETWGDDFIRACLMPFMSFLPANESLIHDLSKVYVETAADVKRIILRLIEVPIKAMGMESFELLKLIEDCPKSSETMVTRVIHILTDKRPPTPDLVNRVRYVYNSRISDVRFLIPVLIGLSKQEILSALPKLIKLNPIIVRNVFNRLLGLHGYSPISPAELLVSLHLIDSAEADLKTVMKATSICLQETQVFTQDVLAVVLQQLMEQAPLPTLLMRTVIQALGAYPRLSGFVMHILQWLILKKVWKQKVVWEGFVKCCQKTIPQSFAVLMQLPSPQLEEALTMCAELREPLREHLLTFTEAQRSHISAPVQEIVLAPFVVPSPIATVPPSVILP